MISRMSGRTPRKPLPRRERVSGGPNKRTLTTKEPQSGIISRQTAWVHRAAATERPCVVRIQKACREKQMLSARNLSEIIIFVL